LEEKLQKSGLNLLRAPGNDAVATTALGMAGCYLVLFTTGRGTPFGEFVPTMKISTNTPLAKKKKNWIDFDAGRLVGEKSMDELLEEFVDYIVDVVNGEQVNNEKNNFREIAIFKSGVTL
jgi:altronate hydrolase